KYKSDARGFHDNKRSQLVMFDLETETYTQLTEAHTHHGFQDISPDGNYVQFAANLNEEADYELTNDLFLLHVATKEVEQLTNGKGTYHSAKFSPKGDKISCLGHEFEFAGATQNELYIFDVENKNRACLSKNWNFQIGDVMIGDTRLGQSETGPIWSEDRSEEHTSELQSRFDLVCRLLLENKK